MTAVMTRSSGLHSEYLFKRIRGHDVSDCLGDCEETTLERSIMKSETKRLGSYTLWPAWATQTPTVLAKAGFYYTGAGDRVECPFCFGILKKWHTNDEPLFEHMKHFPYCRFIQGDDVGNIPTDEREHETRVSRGTVESKSVQGDCDYKREEVRLKSFSRWPPKVSQTPEVLARAGFYHIPCNEKPDRVKCAYCRGKVYNWANGDDPWIEHAKCFPTCPYVRLCMGEEVITDLIGQQQRLEHTEAVVESKSSEGDVNATGDEVTRLMQNDDVQAVLQMGFTSTLVRTALHKWYTGRYCDSVSTQELATSVLELAEGTGLTPNNADDTGSTTPNNNSDSDRNQISDPTIYDMTQAVDPVRTVRDKNAPIRERHLCKVCMENQLRVTFIPCGHLACCGPCSMAMSDCPICRTPITSCVRSYF